MDTLTSQSEGIYFISEEPMTVSKAATRRRIDLWVIVAAIGVLTALLMAAGISSGVRESRRKQCFANLKRLGLAFHEYHEVHGRFPAPALVRSDGTPLLSWRVALLPHLGYQSLYERFHLNEPWDSPHNRSLLTEMPPEFACPGAARHSDGRTEYLVIVGPQIDSWSVNTPFDTRRGVDIREITDGTSNTVLALETDVRVPWTKPHDLAWSPGRPMPHLKSSHKGGAHALFADGTARFLKQTINPNILLALLTVNGGEVVSDG